MRRPRDRRTDRGGRGMTTDVRPVRPELRVPHAGWRVIAAKEFGDHLLSVRFIVLLDRARPRRRDPALLRGRPHPRCWRPQASGAPAVFLALFTLGSQHDSILLRVDAFVGDGGAAARPRLRVRRRQRRAGRGDAAPSAGPADLPRRRDQRQVRRRAGRHRARPGVGHRDHRRVRDASGSASCRTARRCSGSRRGSSSRSCTSGYGSRSGCSCRCCSDGPRPRRSSVSACGCWCPCSAA